MSGGDTLQVVTFSLGKEVFAVPVGLVREILDYREPFNLPNGPDYFVGLTEVRGQGVPTVDFRRRLGLAPVDTTLATRIIILDIPLADATLPLGLVIDRVNGVNTYEASQIEEAPNIGVNWRSDYIQGVIREDDGFVVIVDIACIFTGEEAELLAVSALKAA